MVIASRRAAGALLVMLAACSPFSGSDPTADAGVAAADSGPGNAGDGSVPLDAQVAPFCSSIVPPPSFCADFDAPGSKSPDMGWNGASVGTGDKIGFDTMDWSSPPRSAQFDGSGTNSAVLKESFAPLSTSITVEADVFFPSLVASGMSVAPVTVRDIMTGTEVLFYADAASARFQFAANGAGAMAKDQYSPNLPSPTVRMWHHVWIKVTLGAGGTVEGKLDGAEAWPPTAMSLAWAAPANLEVRVGLVSLYNVVGPSTAVIDNVVVNAK